MQNGGEVEPLNGTKLLVLIAGVAVAAAACGGGGGGVVPPPGSGGAVSGTVVTDSGTTLSLDAARLTAGTPKLRSLRGRPVYVPDQLVVRFRPVAQAQDAESLHRQAGGRLVRTIPQLGVHVVKVDPARLQAALAAYRASPLVQYAEQDAYAYALAAPNDQYYPLQWHYPKIGLPAAWDVVTGGPVIVAVVDSGIRFDHPDLVGVTVPGYDFVDNDPDPTDPGCPTVDPDDLSHGTHVAGTIAALTNNSVGVAGVAWGGASAVKIMPVRVLGEDVSGGECGTGFLSWVAQGIVWAADRGAKVVNLSLAGDADVQALRDAVDYALTRGVTPVAAAGNDAGPVSYPAAYPGVIAVAATACDDTRAYYSNYGPQVWVAAPGGDAYKNCVGDSRPEMVLSTTWSPNAGNVYAAFQGTSMAAPHVAGVAALLVVRGFTTPDAIRNRLKDTAVDLGPSGFDQFFGYGLVNAAAAVALTNPNSSMRVFSGVLGGGLITRQSDFGEVAATGSFTVPNAQPGVKSVFAWQDFNANNAVDAGDYYGRRDGVVINSGQTTPGVVVTVRRYIGSPLPIFVGSSASGR